MRTLNSDAGDRSSRIPHPCRLVAACGADGPSDGMREPRALPGPVERRTAPHGAAA